MMNNKLYETALSYVGTPHINGANVKGAGLDCCTLITNIYKEMGWADIPMEFGYSGDWYCQKIVKSLCLHILQNIVMRSMSFSPAMLSHIAGDAAIMHILQCI